MRGLKGVTIGLGSFILGVGLTLAVSSHAKRPVPPAMKPTITNAKTAIKRVAPSGKATIQQLALGERAFIGLLQMDAGASVPTHRDISEEYVIVMKGSGTITINGKQSKVTKGSVIFMPAGAMVSYKNGPKKLVAIQVFAGPKSATKYRGWKTTK